MKFYEKVAIISISLFLLIIPSIIHAQAPDFTLTDIDGNTFSLSDFRCKVVILEFFGTFCWRCVIEIPHLIDVRNEFGENLVMISLSWTDTDGDLRDFRAEHDISWIVARDTKNVHDYEEYNVTAVPTLYIIDQGGFRRYRHVSVVEASVLIEEVNGLLSECAGDVDSDCDIDYDDFINLAGAYGSNSSQADYDERADFDRDEDVDNDDFMVLAGYYGKKCTEFGGPLTGPKKITESMMKKLEKEKKPKAYFTLPYLLEVVIPFVSFVIIAVIEIVVLSLIIRKLHGMYSKKRKR